MLLRIVLLCCVLVLSKAETEGDKCTAAGVDGVCTLLPKCPPAIKLIKRRGQPKICGFVESTPIVCCTNNKESTVTTPPTITPRSPFTAITKAPPPVNVNEIKAGLCPPVDSTLTSPKTGQKAFDKCVDYQEKYVYPCERSVAITGGWTRGRHCHHNADDLIVGGNDTHAYEFPHMVMLGFEDNDQSILWICGGSIISEQFILTAAHCLWTKIQGQVKYALVGALTRSDANDKNKIYKIKRIIPHPDYQAPSKFHDIALLETEKKMALNQFVVPACLHVGDPVVDSKVLATGWGHRGHKGTTAEIMQKVILEKFTTEACSVEFGDDTNRYDPRMQSCYGDRLRPRDTCPGDSGGPIQIKSKPLNCMYVIVGVTSFGRACGFPSKPAIYTRVAHYVSWIEGIVWP